MIKVMVVDDHELVRTGISRMLSDQDGIRVIGEAASGEEAVKLARDLEPDVVLMDIKMPGMGGLVATRKMMKQDDGIRIIAVTVCEEEPFPSRVMEAGAAGYMTKGADLEEMVRAIKVVQSGQRYISPDIAQAMALRAYKPTPAALDVLSERELQIMTMIVNRFKVQDVADQLCLSPKTVNTYRYRIFDKLGITSDMEMALIAVRHGLVNAHEAVAL
ncbi:MULTISPECIES: UvrY/SirA/GacA family response regulator transcription factor [Alcanivoracaceae]|jgi:two-component system, NarL family, invasion response regulator UvrY|uniref:Two component transcriptional regulator, LuxR family n=5 Tax=Alcanivoracaceae TaxID=224372 RepID=K0CFG3_ALCDB|nr:MULTISPECIES: UvrY/SirA/GacA family response regulator transcription factor [Alcanivoracaceae]ERS10946.1 chemotaxis protein CheY [Alcanivorax sp. PN-3]KYZ88076.1 DNA-binding response regulator [Alcanivorax sp. KX64203]MBA4720181.1 UvrY/SirA/GacA family response regulator transcription factor [Alcanivorax sp.]AFT70306.1 Two component transcriptional regulator, LuxR family [Alloalcanivorax dieselolei B5]KAF0804521.1 DNA-binding response regulator GacA [Alcanivorax xiamenensis]